MEQEIYRKGKVMYSYPQERLKAIEEAISLGPQLGLDSLIFEVERILDTPEMPILCEDCNHPLWKDENVCPSCGLRQFKFNPKVDAHQPEVGLEYQ